jgi:hypothetical protein
VLRRPGTTSSHRVARRRSTSTGNRGYVWESIGTYAFDAGDNSVRLVQPEVRVGRSLSPMQCVWRS